MTSRLEPCDHTEHDAFAWAHVVLKAPKPAMFGNVLWTRSLMQDRRDADLMNWAQTIRRVRADGFRMLKPLNDRVSSADPNPIDYGGDITRFV